MALINGTGANETINGTALDDEIYGGPTTDPNATGTGDDTIFAGGGNDTAYGQDGNDSLWGGSTTLQNETGTGDDILRGGAGNDFVHGQDGNDHLFGDAGADTLRGGVGNDTLDGGDGDDVLTGGGFGLVVGTGDDTLNGGAGNDLLEGEDGNDTLNGDDGNDRLFGASGTNILNGGLGNDQLTSTGTNDVLDGGTGGETSSAGDDAVLDRSTASVALTLALDAQLGVQQNLGDGTLITNIESLNFTGGSGNDTISGLTAGTHADQIRGGVGDDTLAGGGGNDSLFGGAGNDTLDGGTEGDTLYGGATSVATETGTGDDTLRGGAGGDNIFGQDGNDLIFGDADADALWGGAGNDTIDGGDGGDRISGGNTTSATETGTGADTLSGGAGADEMHGQDGDTLNGGDGNDTLFGYSGANRLNGDAGDDTLDSRGSGDVIDGGSGAEVTGDRAVLNRSGASVALTLSLDAAAGGVQQNLGDGTLITNIERLDFTGGSGNDTITGLSTYSSANLFAEADTLRGGAGDDALSGNVGGDTLSGDAGNDTLDGGADNDTLYGGSASLATGTGDDILRGGAGGDTLHGQDGNDQLFGDAGGDTMRGGAGNDTLDGGDDSDNISGGDTFSTTTTETGTGDDVLRGGAGTDQLFGQDGNDTLDGGIGADLMYGHTGDDTLTSFGADQLLDGGSNGETANVGDLALLDRSAVAVALSLSLDAQQGVQVDLGDGTQIINIERLDYTGGSGTDNISGLTAGAYADVLRGGAGNDTLNGGGGNDSLLGGSGSNTLNGGAGDDTLTGSGTNDVVDGGSGGEAANVGDLAVLDRSALAVALSLSLDAQQGAQANLGDGTLVTNIERLDFTGGSGVDTISGLTTGAYADILRGGAGNDLLSGGGGGDSLFGGSGNDRLDGGADNDVLYGGSTSSASETGTGDDILVGGTGNDILHGQDGINTLTGGGGDDTLDGSAGSTTTIVYDGVRADYSFTPLAGGRYQIVDLRAGSPNGTDNAGGIAFVQFVDGTFTPSQLLNTSIGAVSDTDAADNAVAENAASGTAVGLTARAVDPDAGDTVTYSLTDDAGGRFSINTTSGVVSVANGALLDFETATSHNITVRAASSDGSSSTQNFTIAVTDVNETSVGPISDTDAAANAVAENATNGTAVGLTANASDPGDTVSYSLTGSASGRFAIDASSGVVTVADGTLLDREAAPSYDITVQARSSDGSTSTHTFTILLNDVDEFDVGAVADTNAAANSVAENSANGTLVGITASASDADATNSAVSYSLSDSAGGRFAIDATSGVVSVANGTLLDRETAPSHNITVRATSSDGSSSSQSFTIALNDVDEFDVGAVTDANGAANSVAENSANGTLVGVTGSAIDADATNNTISYSLTDSAGGRFAIDATTGVVSVANGALLDFETSNTHNVTVRAASSDGSSTTQTFSIAVSDVGEAGVGLVSDADAAANTVAENAVDGTAVGVTARAVDPDAGDTVSYSLTDNAGGRFAIDTTNGVVTVANGALLDREAAPSHNITVRATSSDGSSSSQSFTIVLNDVDEFDVGAVTDANAVANSVAEDSPAGTLVGITASASDADASNNAISYSLTDDAEGRFAIDGTTGVVSVANGSLLDREAAPSHSITARATSSDGSTSTQSFTVTLSDIDEFDVGPVTDANSAANAVAENSANGTLVGVVASANDADATNSTIGYSLIDNAGGRFAIDATTGVVSVANGALLDFETSTSHSITVRAASSDGSSRTQVFSIAVTDVPEGGGNTPPVITSNGGGASAAVSTAENSTPVTTISATDAEVPAQTLTYSITGGADAAAFSINAQTGALRFVNAPDFENPTDAGANNVYDVVVGVADGNGGADTQAIAVKVTDVAGVNRNGTNGPDALAGTAENDTLNGLGGPDLLLGLAGNDTLAGGAGNDALFGGDGNDQLYGGAEADLLVGGAGRDTLSGGTGNDVLSGGGGADVLLGDAGSDYFEFVSLAESRLGVDADLIADFERGRDRIDLSLIDANAGARGNQAFSATLLAGLTTAFTGAGQLRFGYDSATNQTIIQGNVDNDLSPDFEIHLEGNVPLTAPDFIL